MSHGWKDVLNNMVGKSVCDVAISKDCDMAFLRGIEGSAESFVVAMI